MAKNILFVDDEPNILRGLRRSLRSMRGEWEMEFAGSGEEALQKISSGEVDLLVTDMRMPGMDGLELLRRVTETRPDIIRMVLSGQARKEAIMGIFSAAHQFLSKPCQADVLKKKVSRIMNSRNLVSDGQLASRIAGADPLSVVNSNLSAFIDETGKEKPGPEVIQGLVGRDTAMAAYFLKSAGSGFFGDMSGENKINNIMDSLGPEIIRDLVVEYRVFSAFSENSREDQLAAGISEHSIRVSELAARIAREEGCGPEVVNDSETAGFLHDMGINIFLSYNDVVSDVQVLADEWSS
ncbi:MAG: response regulator, partial [Candidatus Latescibacteria bacterium]|nr:response regulator [bacterium]MBD3423154.1 response regulator [Candidatus Latescibacterota bacterium]